MTSASPSTGSTAGGTLVTMTGSGFPTLSVSGTANFTSVTVGGAACAVQSSSFSQLTCLTSAAPASSALANANVTGVSVPGGTATLYPGGRGASLEFFNLTTGTYYSCSSCAAATGCVAYSLTSALTAGLSSADRFRKTAALSQGAPWSSTTVYDALEMPENFFYGNQETAVGSNIVVRMRAFFTAPTSGNYTFYIASDDSSVLYATGTGSNPAPFASATPVAYVSSYTYARQWFWNGYASSSQISQPYNLTAGQVIFLEAYMQQGCGGVNLAVGARVPGTGAILPTNVPEIQVSAWALRAGAKGAGLRAGE